MKKFKVFYKDDFISEKIKTMIVIAETEMDVVRYFFDRYSGFFLRTEFLGWA